MILWLLFRLGSVIIAITRIDTISFTFRNRAIAFEAKARSIDFSFSRRSVNFTLD